MIRVNGGDRLLVVGKPRASGDDPKANAMLDARMQVNPARAGMIPGFRAVVCAHRCKPRASGDDPSPSPAVMTAVQ